MSIYFELAYATIAKRICLFTGTGFSRALSDNKAPSWNDLLVSVCDEFLENPEFKAALFPEDSKAPNLQLDEIAQVIGLELAKKDKTLHECVSHIIERLELAGKSPNLRKFFENQEFRIATTNYDKLAEEVAGEDVKSICPGRPIPRSGARVKVLHVHGSIDVPEKMVLTSDDYFRFMEKDTYFSRKLSTLLHENTVVILGYSLGDTNLKAILNDYLGFVKDHTVSNSIVFVARRSVPQSIVDYYFNCYGIRVIQNTEIEDFFSKLLDKLPNAEKRYRKTISNHETVFSKNGAFKDSYLKKENSFFEIVASLGALGSSLNDETVVAAFDKIIAKKMELTTETSAWEQYEHLANWLTYLGSLLDVSGTSVEQTFVYASFYSMRKMGDSWGSAWKAKKIWSERWSGLTQRNRTLLISALSSKAINDETKDILSKG